MSYKVSKGIAEDELDRWLKDAAIKYGTFDDGRVNYAKADIAPVVMCTVTYKDKILLAKRSHGLADAEGYWSTINGFIDEVKPVIKQVAQEVKEELGLKVLASNIKVGKSYTMSNPKEKRSYIVFPCLVKLDEEPKIVLDYEHTEYAWIDRKDLNKYEMLDDLPLVIDSALSS
jgi:NADH pyrophosphatase NudC (nudix superfamily)